ncbi:probable cysteine desulfurase [Diadema antillarum]|uniref:probable cysteine desulfurase n=1 Tax=Diadema antillarum TaxID=105358 RepID=UPI003A881E90
MTSSNRTISGVDITLGAADELLRDLDDAIVEEHVGKVRRGGESSPDSGHSSGSENGRENDQAEGRALLSYVEEHVIGKDTWSPGPFGERLVVYCDYTASGRPLSFIEDYIKDHVQPLYANTHTTTGLMARQTTKFRHEARDIIKKCVNATDEDALIFTGSGTTGAVNKLVSALMLKGARAKKTVVFVGPYEHHSNILPWKESGAKIVRIRDDDQGLVNTRILEQQLVLHQKKGCLLIGCFSAASNVTGIISDTHAVAALLHKFGALSFWDYATAGPYMRIDMNPENSGIEGDCSKDAVYLSPHKFVGGVGTPGVLLAKKKLFVNPVPHSVGGGTVLYVTRETHHYLPNIEDREEGGTPAIVESIRAGLTFKLKHAIGTDLIEEREHELTKKAFLKWKLNPSFIFLGSTRAERLPIFSFLIIHLKTGKMLHHNFIAVLLNDLYGIQARGGCACAGPYAQDLLGIDEDLAAKFIYFLKEDSEFETPEIKKSRKMVQSLKTTAEPLEIMKPGFIRLNLPFFFSDAVVDYVLEAVDAIGRHGWKMLSQYSCDPKTANWRFVGSEDLGINSEQSDSLHSAIFSQGSFNAPPCPFTRSSETSSNDVFQTALSDAERIFEKVGEKKEFSADALHDSTGEGVSDPDLIWFMQPHDAAHHILHPDAPAVELRPKTAVSRADGWISESRPTTAADARRHMSKAPFIPKKYARGIKQRLRSAKIQDATQQVEAQQQRGCVIL